MEFWEVIPPSFDIARLTEREEVVLLPRYHVEKRGGAERPVAQLSCCARTDGRGRQWLAFLITSRDPERKPSRQMLELPNAALSARWEARGELAFLGPNYMLLTLAITHGMLRSDAPPRIKVDPTEEACTRSYHAT